MGYVNAMVFFIDILGSQSMEDFETLFDVNITFHSELEKNQGYDKPHTVYERKVYTFSDCAYIIYNFKDGIEEHRKDLRRLFDIALRNTENLIIQFLKKDFLCRGGVSYGELYYEKDRSLFFGPAINKVYRYESKEAVYPRIIIDDYIADNVITLNQEWIDNEPDPLKKHFMQEINGNIVKKDKDGKYFLHYLNCFELGVNYIEMQSMYENLQELIIQEIGKQQENIKNNPKDRDKYERVIAKYDWFKEYLDNSFPNRNSASVILPYIIK